MRKTLVLYELRFKNTPGRVRLGAQIVQVVLPAMYVKRYEQLRRSGLARNPEKSQGHC
jgi:hypothetical protein